MFNAAHTLWLGVEVSSKGRGCSEVLAASRGALFRPAPLLQQYTQRAKMVPVSAGPCARLKSTRGSKPVVSCSPQGYPWSSGR